MSLILTDPRAKRLWDFYRITPEDYERMLAFQRGICAISGKPPVSIRLAVDHNHKTGQIRGLLSPFMNKGIGYFEDNPKLLRAAADYIENPPAVLALGREVYGLIGQAKQKKKMVYGPPESL